LERKTDLFIDKILKRFHLSISNEWKRSLIGGSIIGMIYVIIAAVTGLSDFASRTSLPIIGSILGAVLGCVYLIVYFIMLEIASQNMASGFYSKKYFTRSYVYRYLFAGVILFIGFMFFDPFAVFAVMLSPRITYLFLVFIGKDI